MSALKTYSVVIFGQPFSLVSDESREEVEKVAAQVDALMKKISVESGVSDLKRIAILASVNLLCQVRELEQSVSRIDTECQQWVALIDTVL